LSSEVTLLLTTFLLLVLLAYPFVIYPAVLNLMPRRPFPRPTSSDSPMSAALVFCAYNEEKSLPEKLRNLRAIKERAPALEIIAYSDCSTDRTLDLLATAPDVVRVIAGDERLGKATGMKRLVASTQAEIIICTDANVNLEITAIDRLLAYFRDPSIGTVAGTLHYVNDKEGQTARVGSLFWRLEEWIKGLESATGSTMGADGSIFAIRSRLYPTVPPHLLDDLIASITPLFAGYRVVSAPDVHAFERTTTDSVDEFRRKRRIACRAYNTHRFLVPQLRHLKALDKFKYFSHKYLRWFSFLSLLLVSVSATIALAVFIGFVPAFTVVFSGAAFLVAAHWFKLPLIGTVAEMLVSIVAVGIGVIDAMSGRTYQTWVPAKSRQ